MSPEQNWLVRDDPRKAPEDEQTVDREAPTPKCSDTLARWPMLREAAMAVFNGCSSEALVCEKVYEKLSYTKAGHLRRIARQARALAEAFEHWEFGDPGDELRRGAIAKLYDLRQQARDHGAKVD